MREKLIELIRCTDFQPCKGAVATIGSKFTTEFIEAIADHLIENGVTVLDEPLKIELPDNIDKKKLVEMLRNRRVEVFHDIPEQRWIPVSDRLPTEEDAIEGGFVLAYTAENKVIIALWNDVCRFSEFVTHWMPLPEPPKGE